MRVLVIGGNGRYSKLITSYLAEDFEITIFDLNDQNPGFKCDLIKGSVLRKEQLIDACKNQDAILTFFKGNAEITCKGMTNLMAAAEINGIKKVIYTSSGGMSYPIPPITGNAFYNSGMLSEKEWEEYFPISEDVGLFPGLETDEYFHNKFFAECIGRHFAKRGVGFTSIRPGNLMLDDMGTIIPGEKEKVVNPTHLLVNGHVTVKDCAVMYKCALKNAPEGFSAYNLSNDTHYSMLSVEKAEKELGYKCKDQNVYLNYYKKQDWKSAYDVLVKTGIPRGVLDKLYQFKDLED